MKFFNLLLSAIVLSLFIVVDTQAQDITGTVWEDTNGNGFLDGAEAGLGGVFVELRDQFGTPVGIDATTDGAGDYTLTGGLAGLMYQVYFDIPAYDPAYVGCLPNQGGDPTIDSDMVQLSFTYGTFILLPAGATDIDAGVFFTVEIGDLVWLDDNGNGLDDDGSISLPVGVDVTLEQEFPLGGGIWVTANDYLNNLLPANPINTTDFYNYIDISPGNYRLVFADGSGGGLYHTYEDVGGGNTQATDLANDSDAQRATGMSHEILLISGDPASPYTSADAGYFAAYSIEGYVWEDLDGNGLDNDGSGATPMAVDVTLEIESPFGSGAWIPAADEYNSIGTLAPNPINTSTTYSFLDLPPGNYRVLFSEPGDAAPADMHLTETNAGGDGGADVGDDTDDSDPERVAVGGNGITHEILCTNARGSFSVTDVNAGYFLPVRLGDFVFEDLVADGDQTGDPGLADPVDISLFRIDIGNVAALDVDGNPYVVPINQNGAGIYEFFPLPPGEYEVQFDWIEPDLFATEMDQVADDLDSDIESCIEGGTPGTSRTPTTPFLFSDDEDLTLDAGFFKPARISDFVWEDLNANGIQDVPGPGILGVMIEITDINTGAIADYADCTTTAGTVTTDGVGFYEFINLRPGDYTLQFTAPSAPDQFYFSPYNAVGGADFAGDRVNDSDCDGMNAGNTFVIDLMSDDDTEDIDCGMFRAGSIGDYTWEDLNGDGVQDGGEPALGGVDIDIEDVITGLVPISPVTMMPVLTQTSDGAGFYEFEFLPPGMYELTFTAPTVNHYLTREDYSGGATDATDVGDDSDPVEINGNVTHVVELDSGEHGVVDGDNDVDAGYVLPILISGLIWHDGNADGSRAASENLPLIGGFTVTVIDVLTGMIALDVMGLPAVIAIPPSGIYEFSIANGNALKPGTYDIQLDGPAGWFVTMPGPDSDFNQGAMPRLLVTQLMVDSDGMEENVDGGVWKRILVGGFVWGDGDGSCTFDMGVEQGYPNDVMVQIIDANGDDACMVNTDNTGFYCCEVDPGIYDIVLMASNFATDLDPLYQTIPCDGGSPPNSDTPLDNNGNGGAGGPVTAMGVELICGDEPGGADFTENKTIDFGLMFDCDAENNPFAWLSCEDAADNPICNVNLLAQGCGTMPTPPNNAGPSPLCPGGGGIPHNMSWFSFIAGYGDYDIEIALSGCTPGTGGSTGIQSGLYLYDPDNATCWGDEAPYCEDACVGGNIILDGFSLIPGNQYLMFLDGCNGSICGYDINILGNYIPFVVNDAEEVTCNGEPDCGVVCPGTTLDFEAFDDPLTYDELENLLFHWSLRDDMGNIIDDFINFGNDDYETENNIISVEFLAVGTYTICLDEITDICQNAVYPDICQEIVVVEYEDEDFGIIELCPQDLFAYGGPNSVNDEGIIFDPNMDGVDGWVNSTFFQVGENTETVTDALGCIYDQTVEIFELENNFGDVDTAVCGISEFPLNFLDFSTATPVEGLVWTGTDQAANGCDSTISIDAYNLEVAGDFSFLCAPGGFEITFTESSNSIGAGWLVGSTTEWTDAMGNVITPVMGDPYKIIVSDGGVYTFTIIFTTEFGTLDNEIVCPYVFNYTLDPGNLAPAEPTADNWENQFCEYDNIFTYIGETDEDVADIISYNWYYPIDATLIGTDDTDSLTLDWTGSAGGEVCFTITNECGEGPPVCDTITIVETPVAAVAPFDTICIDDITQASYPGAQDPNFNYAWFFDGGTPVGGTNVPGPIDVSWSEPGDYIVTLNINKFGCVSDLDSSAITVVAPVAPPTVNCSATLNEVVFTWVDVPGATGYNPMITSGQDPSQGTLDGNTYTVIGLDLEELVTITLGTSTDSPCPIELSTGGCTTQDCPTFFVTTDPVSAICFDASTMPIDLTLMTDNPFMYDLNWVGTGITDAAAGTFDPKLASPGSNMISVSLVDENDCVYNSSVTINVNPIPTSDFIVEDVICQDSLSTIEYTGSIVMGGQFDWTFDNPTAPGAGPGPFDVQWNTPGEKTITLSVTQAGCTSSESTFPVTVEPRIEPLDLECDGDATSIDFSWGDNDGNPLGNVTDYTLILTYPNGDMETIMTTDLTYGINGLTPGDTVNIQIIADSDNSCPGVVLNEDCIAQNCPDIFITLNVADTTLCNDATAMPFQLSAIVTGGPMVGGAIETWGGPGVDPNTGIFDPAVAGNGVHTITYLYEESTCSENETATIRIIDQPTSDFSAPPVICVTDVLAITYDGSAPSLPFDWDADGTTVEVVGGNLYSAMWNAAGTYDITLQVGQGTCLSDFTTISVQVDPEMDTVVIGCVTDLSSVSFDWNDIDCAGEYEVIINNVSIGTQTTFTHSETGLNEGDEITIEIIPTAECECPSVSSTRTCKATACPPVVLELSSPNIKFCAGTITNPFTLGVNVVGSENPGSGVWTGNGIAADGTWDPTGQTAGLYTFEYDYNETACDFNENIVIEILENPVAAALAQDPDCYQDNVGSVEITGTGGTGNYDLYLDGVLVTQANLNALSPNNYDVQIIDEEGCLANTTFTVNAAVAAETVINGNVVIKAGADATLTLDVTSIDGVLDSIVWTLDGDTIICSGIGCSTIIFTPDEDGQYCATMYYNDGCTVQECVDVRVVRSDVIILPNIITLTGNGGNEEFYIPEYETITSVKSFTIFDRWGNVAFKVEDVPKGAGNGWDGTLDGKEVEQGVYVYAIKLNMENGDVLSFSGDVTVIR